MRIAAEAGFALALADKPGHSAIGLATALMNSDPQTGQERTLTTSFGSGPTPANRRRPDLPSLSQDVLDALPAPLCALSEDSETSAVNRAGRESAADSLATTDD